MIKQLLFALLSYPVYVLLRICRQVYAASRRRQHLNCTGPSQVTWSLRMRWSVPWRAERRASTGSAVKLLIKEVDKCRYRHPSGLIAFVSLSMQRTGGLFGLNADPFSSEPNSPLSTQMTSQRPLQFAETRLEDVESPPDSVFLPNTVFFPDNMPTTTNTNNNAKFIEE